ncbi:MAG TPA: phospholipase A [Caldimonas sp.]|nr:phospholipase A [Caldimonas sp.]
MPAPAHSRVDKEFVPMQFSPSGRAVAALGLALATTAPMPSLAASSAATEPPLPDNVVQCAGLRVDAERLACYDKAVAPQLRAARTATAPGAAASEPAAVAAIDAERRGHASPDDKGDFLDEFWELSPKRKRGTFNFTGYQPSYFFPVHVTSGLNRHPDSPAGGHAGQLPDYRNVEAKLQISIRTKLAEDVGLPDADLWFAYTQQSLWQLYSAGISRPFRATDHQPEIFYVVPAPFDLPYGVKLKMTGIGLAHQSNGQSLPFSRSWNRWYVLGGLEKGEFALTARYNTRIHESDGNDDNPDLTKYRGRTELLGIWTPGFYTLSALWKTNFDSRGSLQLDFTTPVSRKDPKGLRWYVQLFSGYGETLIDYNFRQTSLGAGVTLFGW